MANLPSSTPVQLRRVLGLPALVFFGLVYMVPLTIFTTYGIVTELTGGRTACLLYTSPSPRDLSTSRMPSSA